MRVWHASPLCNHKGQHHRKHFCSFHPTGPLGLPSHPTLSTCLASYCYPSLWPPPEYPVTITNPFKRINHPNHFERHTHCRILSRHPHHLHCMAICDLSWFWVILICLVICHQYAICLEVSPLLFLRRLTSLKRISSPLLLKVVVLKFVILPEVGYWQCVKWF